MGRAGQGIGSSQSIDGWMPLYVWRGAISDRFPRFFSPPPHSDSSPATKVAAAKTFFAPTDFYDASDYIKKSGKRQMKGSSLLSCFIIAKKIFFAMLPDGITKQVKIYEYGPARPVCPHVIKPA